MRLDKFLSDTTELSRSDAKRAIKAERVQVNNQVITSANYKIEPSDSITLDNNGLQLTGPRYFMLNKPQGYVCATQDSDHPTVLSLLQEPQLHKLHIAGRLDKDTTGLVLITDDGQWSHRVTSPNHDCYKRYRVELDSTLTSDAILQLQQGILLKNETKPTKPAKVEMVSEAEILLTISEGKYHQVKRMLAAVGNHVCALHRECIGSLNLDNNLALGEYRPLTQQESAFF